MSLIWKKHIHYEDGSNANLATIGGLSFQVDAEFSVETTGTDVDTWTDLVDTDVVLTATDAPQYNASDSDFNNQPTIDFDGVDDYMQSNAFTTAITSPCTIFLVCKVNGITNETIFAGIDATDNHRIYASSNLWAYNAGALIRSNASQDTNPHIFVVQSNGNGTIGCIDGKASWAGEAGSNDLAGVTLGGNQVGSSLHNVTIANVAIFDRLLTNAEVNSGLTILSNKYGISVTLLDTVPQANSNVIAWSAADHGTAYGTGIDLWADQSGNSNYLENSVTGEQPTVTAANVAFNSKPTLDFDGTDDDLQLTTWSQGTISQPMIMFLVMSVNTPGAGDVFIDSASVSSSTKVLQSGTDEWSMDGGTAIAEDVGTLGTDANIIVVEFNGASSNLFVAGGIPKVFGNAGTDTAIGLTIGSDYNGANNSAMSIAEYVIGIGTWTTSDIGAITDYLSDKYALPYVNFNPMDITGLAWVLDPAYQAYIDAGTTLSTDTDEVEEWHDRVADKVFGNTTTIEQPHWIASAVNGLPGVDFDLDDVGLYVSEALLSSTSGYVYFVFYLNDLDNRVHALYSQGYTSEALEEKITVQAIHSVSEGLDKIHLHANASGPNHVRGGDSDISTGIVYSVGIFCDGTNPATMRVNSVEQAMITDQGSDTTRFWMDISGNLNETVIGNSRAAASANSISLGGVILFAFGVDGETPTAAEIVEIESFIAETWGA